MTKPAAMAPPLGLVQAIKARQAGEIHEVIERLPKGYHGEIGERAACMAGRENEQLIEATVESLIQHDAVKQSCSRWRNAKKAHGKRTAGGCDLQNNPRRGRSWPDCSSLSHR
jgi:hypothetical protein